MVRATTSKKKPSLAKVVSPAGTRPSHEEIALRAYAIFLQRERIHGWDLEDWLQAERELLQESKKRPGRQKKSELAGLIVQ